MLLMLKDEFIHILRVSHVFFVLSLYLFLRNSSYLFLSFSFLLSLSLSLSLIYCDGRGSLPNDEGNKAGHVDDTGYLRVFVFAFEGKDICAILCLNCCLADY